MAGKHGNLAFAPHPPQGFVYPPQTLDIFRVYPDTHTKTGFADPDMAGFQIGVQGERLLEDRIVGIHQTGEVFGPEGFLVKRLGILSKRLMAMSSRPCSTSRKLTSLGVRTSRVTWGASWRIRRNTLGIRQDSA